MSSFADCNICKQAIPNGTKFWAIVLTEESYRDGGVDTHDVFYLRAFCEKCSKQYNLMSTQIRENQISSKTSMNSKMSTLNNRNTQVSAIFTCLTCQKEILDGTKYWAVSLNQESFDEEHGPIFPGMISVHNSSCLHISCEDCAKNKDFKSLRIPKRQPDCQEMHSQL